MRGIVRALGPKASTPTSPRNAASVLLARCNLKHDLIEETDLTADLLAGYRALLEPNAAT